MGLRRVGVVGCLVLSLALSGCGPGWIVSDDIDYPVDPDVEIKRVFELSGDVYQDVAYHVLTEAKKRPKAVRYKMRWDTGYESWRLEGGRGERDNTAGSMKSKPNLAVTNPSRNSIAVYWDRDHPDMVFFIHRGERRSEPGASAYKYYRGLDFEQKSVERVVLAFHPGQKPPTRFRLEQSADPEVNKRHYKARESDPDVLVEPSDWVREPFKPNWSLLYPR